MASSSRLMESIFVQIMKIWAKLCIHLSNKLSQDIHIEFVYFPTQFQVLSVEFRTSAVLKRLDMINKLQAILNIRMHAFLWVLLKHPSCKWDFPPAKDSLELQPTFVWSRFYSWVHLPSPIATMRLHMDSLFPRVTKEFDLQTSLCWNNPHAFGPCRIFPMPQNHSIPGDSEHFVEHSASRCPQWWQFQPLLV